MTLKEATIRAACQVRRLKWTRHAKKQLMLRSIRRSEVLHVLEQGQIVEQYPKAKPYSECLMMGFVRNNEPLYVELAHDNRTNYNLHYHSPLDGPRQMA